MAEPKVRIFVSSPSDLEHERVLVKDVIEALAQEYRPYFLVQSILWEEEALTAAQSFQAGLLRPSECEIVLVMLWTRLGTPLAEDPYGGLTGTEWEFVDAVEASARTGSPEVLVYRKTAPRLVDVNNAEATREALADRHRLEEFFRAHFFNPDGSFSRAFRQFGSDRAFRELVETQLRKLLNRRISAERRFATGAGDWRGSPFRALRPFDVNDDRIFTGREIETRELLARLEALQSQGRGLLLLTGPSGVGKSSLIRAGLLPRLARPFLFPDMAGCRWCFVDLEAIDPILSLTSALSAPAILGPALERFGLDPQRMGRLLISEPEVAADQIGAALARLDDELAEPQEGTAGRRQLVVVVDPLDPLFQDGRQADAPTRVFAVALGALAAQSGIWVICSLRSDHLRHLAALPELARLLGDQGWFPVEPAPPGRIRPVMEIPARIAGLEYEGLAPGGGRGLVEVLEAEASRLVHWAPLLQSTLEAIYQRAEERVTPHAPGELAHPRLLSVQDYRGVGGLSGVLVGRAEALWETLAPETRAALPILCRALLSLEGVAAAPAARSGDLSTLERDPNTRQLIETLVEARLLVAEAQADPESRHGCAQDAPRLLDDLRRLLVQTGEEWRGRLRVRRALDPLEPLAEAASTRLGPALEPDVAAAAAAPPDWEDYRPVIGFVHPALFERWRPVRDWLDLPENRRDLVLRHQISRQARLWKRTDCNREYLLGEAGYAAARRFADAHTSELEPLEIELLEQSHQHLILQRRRNRGARILGLTLVTLLALASSTAYWAWNASREATLNLQRSLLKAADIAIQQGNTPEAVRLALDAGPYLPALATDTLSRAFTTNRLIAMAHAEDGVGDRRLAPAFRDDGDRVITQSSDAGGQLWTLRGQRFRPEARLYDLETPIHAVRIIGLDENESLIGIGESGVWRLPTEPGRPPDWSCGARVGSPIAVDHSGRYLALSHGAPQDRFAVCVLDLERPGEPLWDRALHTGEVRSLAFSPDGRVLVTASRDGSARVLATRDGRERVSLPLAGPLSRPANHAEFDAAGERIAVSSADERVRVYDLAGRELAELGVITRDGREVRVHRSAVREAAFSPAGHYLVAGDDAGQVVRWNLATGQAEVIGHHGLSVEHVRISLGDGADEAEPFVLTASLDKTARLWGLLTGREIAVFSHDAAVSEARFSRDGRRILTYSELDGSARLWSVQPTETLAYHLPSADHVWHLAMTPAPRADASNADAPGAVLIATAAFDGLVEVWRYERHADAVQPTRLWSLRGHQGRVRRVAFSPRSERLASAGFDGTARIWDLDTSDACVLPLTSDGQPCAATRGQTCPSVQHALFSPDGRWLMTTATDTERPLRLWDPERCAPLDDPLDWGERKDGIQAAATIRDATGATLVAVGDERGGVRVMRVDPGGEWRLLCDARWHLDLVTEVAFAPDGDRLATTSEDGRSALVELNAAGCGEPRYLEPGAGVLYSVRFTPDGEALVTAAMDARAQVWDRDGTLIAELVGHKDRIYTAEPSPDGRWLLTASRDGSVRIWPRPTRLLDEPLEAYLVLSAGRGGVAYATFSPDGNNIGGAYWENATQVWRLWSESPTPDRRLETFWGRDRARLALIREAVRFRQENRLDSE